MFPLVIAALCAQAPQVTDWTHLPLTSWQAWLESPGGELRFGLRFRRDASGALRAQIANEPESIDVPVVAWAPESNEVALAFPHYDSSITATASAQGDELRGSWRKRRGADRWTQMPFAAHRRRDLGDRKALHFGSRPLDQLVGSHDDADSRFFGVWRAQFASDQAPSVAIWSKLSPQDDGRWVLTPPRSHFSGTFITTLGDYRYLSGRLDFSEDQLELSCFDGAHAFLFKAKLLENGSLAGDFWSGDSWHDTWTAVRDDSAALPDPFGLTKSREGVKLDELAFPDLDGVLRKLGDAQFAGKARVVQLFGTWCPNCNDETRYLAELHERYGARGLSILGLAFEHTGDFARDAGQVRKYAAHHRIAYPLLVAGVSDKRKASERFPLLDKVRAYPTTLFVDSKGAVRAVHQGFSGPAAGSAHVKLRQDFERLIESLLAEAK